MIDITAWMHTFLQRLNETFAGRVWFVGLQGSYSRGEARDTSDIDIVVILDELSAVDIQAYRDMLDTMSHRELICGFLSGKKELLNWEPSDLFQFCHDTVPIKGSLDEVMAVIDESAVNRAIKIGACNIYHGCVHNMLHEKSEDVLRMLYKSASFVVQAIVFKQTGNYIPHQKDLLQAVSSEEQFIVETYMHLKNGGSADFELLSETLFAWAKKQIGEAISEA
jgi:predicted nucleotidyltransferase